MSENSNTERVPYLFTSKEWDSETGLYYYGARYMDPRTSVWLSPDPALREYLADNTINRGVNNSFNLNLYIYSYQNPVIFKDPDGKKVRITISSEPSGSYHVVRIVQNEGSTRESRYVLVPTYKMTVTDDVSKKTSTYYVTRDAYKENNRGGISIGSFEPGPQSKGQAIRQTKNSTTFNAKLKRNRHIDRDVVELKDRGGGNWINDKKWRPGRPSRKGVQIHIGGYRKETKDWAGSLGCFMIVGPVEGEVGDTNFINDIRNRQKLNEVYDKKKGYMKHQRIEVTIQHRKSETRRSSVHSREKDD